jgi:hypothetical protein
MNPVTRIAATAFACLAFVALASAEIPPGYTGTPFKGDTLLGKPQQIPGVVKGTFVDVGGGNVTTQDYSNWDYDVVGYGTNGQLDSSVNAAHKTSHLAYMGPGVNPKYTVHVNTAGTYYVDFKLANVGAPPNLITLTYYDGAKVQKDSVKDLPMVVTVVPPPGGVTEIWHNWTVNFKVDSVKIDTGLQVFQITFAKGAWNYDWMRFRLQGGTGMNAADALRSQAGPMGIRTVVSGGSLSVSYNVIAAGSARISLVDCVGKTVRWSIDENGAAGNRTAGLDVRNLRRGVYFINIECGGTRETKSVIITR